MSEEQVQAPPTTEETPTETPAAETPAATEDQPAVTEVTEVTPAESEPEPKPKEEAAPKEEAPKEEVKEKPQPPPAKVVDYRTSKAGWVDKQGLIFKKWQHQYMTLDEEDSVLRWWKTENRTGSDGALFMKYCADVSEPKAEATTTWPDNTADRCFVVSSPYRAFFLVAESADEKNDWIQKLTAAKEKYNTEGRKVITNELISLEGIKAALDSGAADADRTLKEEGVVKEEKKPEDAPPPAEGEQMAPAESGEGVAEVTVEVNVETPKDQEPPKQETPAAEPPKDSTAEEPPKEEAPAAEPPKEDTPPAEEPPKEETSAEEPPKETPAEEQPKEETPAATEGGEGETKAED